jgi:hypothetical protein|tara:strand:+ start:425 stop:853 length:429 start_codon:yes stop_codon:yes gene_type:complete
MSVLSKLWQDKINSRNPRVAAAYQEKPYKVQWDHPDYPKGTKLTREYFKTIAEANEYAIKIGLQYDLRKYDGVIPSLDPNLSRYKSGYTPMESEDKIPFVIPMVETKGMMPMEVTPQEIEDYKIKHNISVDPKIPHIFKGDN